MFRLFLALTRPLWFDELFTLWAARPPLSRLVAILANDSGPPLFYALEIPFVAAGERIFFSDVTVRALPWAAALALFACALALPPGSSRRRFALLLALSPLLTVYSGEARAYALLSLLVFLAYLVALVRPESARGLAMLFLLSAAALYTHYLALFAVAALALVTASEKRSRSALATAAGALPFLAWAPVMSKQPAEAVAWMHESPRALVGGVLSSFGGAGRIPPPFGEPLPPALVASGGALGLLLVGVLALSWKSDVEARRGLAFLVLFLGAVIFASLARPVGFAGRTEMAVLPVWLFTIARAGERSRAIRYLTTGALAVGAVAVGLIAAAPRPVPFPLQALARLEKIARPGDVLFAGLYFYLPARLAADRGRLEATVLALPPEQAAHPGWSEPSSLAAEELEVVRKTLARVDRGSRVFFAVPPPYAPPLARVLGEGGSVRQLARSSEMVLMVWGETAAQPR